ncbi:MAG TPA: hypothetical protein VID04_07805 [Methylomirabilota bacterium]|jgi:hypothetical protein
MRYFEPNIFAKALLVISALATVGGCASTPPSALQWWRVGDCLVVYDDRVENRHMVVAGHQCDIKRQEMTDDHGVTRTSSR